MEWKKTSFLIHHEDVLSDKGKIIEAFNHEEAAKEYAHYYNSGHDYCLFDDEIEFTVAKLNGAVIKFKATAERSIEYSITPQS